MSVGLFVKLKHPVSIKQLERLTESALKDLLPSMQIPSVRARLENFKASTGANTDLLTLESPNIIFSLDGYDEEVRAMSLVIPLQEPLPNGSYSIVDQLYANVSWNLHKTALNWMLVAAVTIALARNQGSSIEDNASFFMQENTSSPEDLVKILRSEAEHGSFDLAAQAVYYRMPKASLMLFDATRL